MEIRPLTPADIDAAAELTARVFGTAEQYESYYELSRAANLYCPFTPPELCYGLFDAGQLVAKWQLVDASIRVLGTAIRAAGSMAVAADPRFRAPQVVRRLVDAGRADVQARGFDLVLGIAQRGSIYHRIGGRPICAEQSWELDALHVPEPKQSAFRVASDADTANIVSLYNRENAARSGTIVRTKELYAFLPRRAPETWLHPDGYVGVRVGTDGLEVREVGGFNDDFFDAALRELAARARALGLRRVFGAVPSDHGLVLASAAYGAKVSVHYARASGCMAGTAGGERFLSRLQPELERRLHGSRFDGVRVVLSMQVDGHAWSLELGEPGAPAQTLTMQLPGGALVQLACGYLPPRTILAAAATEQGHAPPRYDAAQLALLEVLFAQPVPFMWLTDRT